MKRKVLLLALLILLSGCGREEPMLATAPPETVAATTAPAPAPTQPETIPETEPTQPPVVLELTEEEQTMLLKIAMAEVGPEECPTCLALVMRTVLNRVESPRFSKTISGVLHAQDQFTPVMDGSYEEAVPNDACQEALDMVLRGWDESQGALYYEFFPEGVASWHSRNLTLLTQHCGVRFYLG